MSLIVVVILVPVPLGVELCSLFVLLGSIICYLLFSMVLYYLSLFVIGACYFWLSVCVCLLLCVACYCYVSLCVISHVVLLIIITVRCLLLVGFVCCWLVLSIMTVRCFTFRFAQLFKLFPGSI